MTDLKRVINALSPSSITFLAKRLELMHRVRLRSIGMLQVCSGSEAAYSVHSRVSALALRADTDGVTSEAHNRNCHSVHNEATVNVDCLSGDVASAQKHCHRGDVSGVVQTTQWDHLLQALDQVFD